MHRLANKGSEDVQKIKERVKEWIDGASGGIRFVVDSAG
jgi:hypothetical protein